jgi:transcriptional regulator with XRE-family HTH domain
MKDPLQKLGVVVRLRRHELNLSQQELAARAGEMDRSYLSEIESGRKNVSFTVFLRLAAALDLTPAEFMGRMDL